MQSKMLLPTYDVFDEMRNFAPAKNQAAVPILRKEVALTICEDAWNDKHFWNKRLYTLGSGRSYDAGRRQIFC